MNGMVPIYGADGTLYYVTPEAALRSIQEGSGYATDPTAIYSPEAAQQLSEFTAALQGEDVYTRRLQALAQQYGAQTQRYGAVAQNAYNMGQLLMNASINNPYQYAQQAFGTNGSAPGFARALAQGFSYGEPTADPFDTSRLKGWDFGKTSTEQGSSAAYGGGQQSTQSTGGGQQAQSSATNGAGSGGGMGAAVGGGGGLTPLAAQGAPGVAHGAGTAPGPLAASYGPSAAPSAANVAPATSGAYSNTATAPMTAYGPSQAVYGPNGKVDTGAYGRASGLSGSGSSDIAHVNKSHNLIEGMGYGHGSDARNRAHAAAGMTGEEFDRIVKHGGDPFRRNQATGGMQVATRPETVHVGEGGRDELLIALPLQRPGTAVPGFAAQIANSLHPQGNYVAHGGVNPPGLHFAEGGAVGRQSAYGPVEYNPSVGGLAGGESAIPPPVAPRPYGPPEYVPSTGGLAGGEGAIPPRPPANASIPSRPYGVPERAVSPVNLPRQGGPPMAGGGGYGGGAPALPPAPVAPAIGTAPAFDPVLMGKAARWWAAQHGGNVADGLAALALPENAGYLDSALGMAAAGEIDAILGPEQPATPNGGPSATTGLTRDPNWQRAYLQQQAARGRGDYGGAVMGGVDGGLRLGGRVTDANTPVHMAQGGAVYGSGVNTIGVGNYRMSGATPTPQGSVRVYGNRGGMKTAPVTEGILPAMQADPTALDRIAANKFLATSYDSLLRQQGYAGLDDYLARNQAARPQQRVQAGISYRGY